MDTDFQNMETESDEFKTSLERLESKADNASTQVIYLINQANRKLKETNEAIDVIKKDKVEKDSLRSELQKAESALASAQSLLERSFDPTISLRKSVEEGALHYKKAYDQNALNKKINQLWTKIQKRNIQTIPLVNNLINSFNESSNELIKLKKQNNLITDDLSSMIVGKNVLKLQNYYQEKLSAALGISNNILLVQVTTDGRNIKLKYQYPDSKQDFKLEGGVIEPRFVTDHIIQQIRELNEEDATIGKIIIAAELQARKSSLEETRLNTLYNENDFGLSVKVDYQFFNEIEKTIQSLSTTIVPGSVNMLELACLKIHGLKKIF